MRSRFILAAAGLTVLALGGCHHKPAPTEAAVTPNVAPPVRKPGLWKEALTYEGSPGITTVSMCLDEATDKQLAWWSQGSAAGCQEQTLTKSADGAWNFTCKASGSTGTVDTTGTARGDFENAYTLDGTIIVTGSPIAQLAGTHHFSVAATRTGDCPADMKPGEADVPSPSGTARVDMLSIGKPQQQ